MKGELVKGSLHEHNVPNMEINCVKKQRGKLENDETNKTEPNRTWKDYQTGI